MHSSTIARVSSAENLLANLGRRMRAAAPPLFWTGVGMLALSLPTDFVGRELVITATFGLVVVSILLQGTTMAALLRRLRLTSNDQIDDRR